MSNYKLSEPSVSLLNSENWERILKFLVVNVAGAVVLAVVMIAIIYTVGMSNKLVGGILLFIAALLVQSYMLGWYEKWRGCHFTPLA